MIDASCQQCSGQMVGTHSRKLAGYIDRRRKCKCCGFVDRVLVQPEVIVRYIETESVLYNTTGQSDCGDDVVKTISAQKRVTQAEKRG